MTDIPASITHKNPSAMGLGASAKKFGAGKHTRLKDGNTIATFPTTVDGASAQMHLLWSPAYRGLSMWDALHKWGDGATLEKRGKVYEARQRTGGYVAAIEQRSRFKRGDILTKEMMEDRSLAIEFCKAQAWHEAGIEYPMTDDQWVEAHEQFVKVINGGKPALDLVAPVPQTAPLEMAKTHLGERRIAGPGTNPFIEDLFKEIGSPLRGDDHSYCAAGAGAMLKRSGFAYIHGEPGQLARNYLNYGHALDEPEEGCLVIFWRVKPNSWQGHVAFVESWTATTLTIIGFNQSGAVTRMTVPRTGSRSQVLGYRRPVKNVRPASEIAREKSVGQKAVGILGTLVTLFYAAKDWFGTALEAAWSLGGSLPDTAAAASQSVSTAREITDAAGLPWVAQAGLLIVLFVLVSGLYKSWKRLRPNDGHLTKPPYETDVDPEVDALDSLSVAADLPPKRSRRKPAKKPAKTTKKAPAKRKRAA